jgi:transposase
MADALERHGIEPGQPGRPHKLTDERIDKIVELVRVGNYVEVACAAVGMTANTYYRYMRTGKALIEKYDTEEPDEMPNLTHLDEQCVKLVSRIKVANAEAEAYAVTIIRSQMPQQWTAAMTFLERRFPGRWKRRDETVIKSPLEVGAGDQENGIDEQALLRDPEAVKLLHAALELASAGALPVPDDKQIVEATVVDDAPPNISGGEDATDSTPQ